MNFGLLLIIPAIGGYWVLTRLHLTHHQTVRGEGYHVLFKSAGVGAAIFAVAHLVVLLIYCLFPQAKETWRAAFPYPFSATVALGILFSYLIPCAGNRIWKEEESADMAAAENGDRIELLIRESIRRGEFVEISLKTRKSYIGRTLGSTYAAGAQQDISLIPVASGYRDRDTQQLHLTTNYAPVMERSYPEAKSFSDYLNFRIVIPKDQVVSIRLFDPDAYLRFQLPNDPALDQG